VKFHFYQIHLKRDKSPLMKSKGVSRQQFPLSKFQWEMKEKIEKEKKRKREKSCFVL